MKKLNKLDSDGFYIEDYIEGYLPKNWTDDLVGDGYYKAQYQNATVNPETGEWTCGQWVETSGPSATDIAAQKAEFVAQAKLKKSKLISDASDRIEILKDRIEAGQDRAAELKLWKSYRIALDDIDVSTAPDIMWPVSPDNIKLPVVLTKAKLGN
ncbi:caudovirales tail fiber assembly family protein [Yersinia pseudotuberculosis IP 32953]|uniref:Putative phage tail fiber assembly protein n=1 Tax=Yersinia pseudotuberculosis serotype I (strain IP32953) TaxID=273123 RepID=Q66BF1_YERPS|nr:tail fiber assembly protein [Yersinia pseudotuberculosis]AJJ53948.1 caudovirales tail fiber assembly family protein [Yersinia pseudotuberculosis IP 32953]PSH40408.1 phage tail protein [Yersinia pseudotuberculosis]PSH44785.1 phage tail protein [Yersinia pseudotuberculosis]CAH21059.1 putative phage tail fiber assembly protein [Yersinia pseudotuberculosis IP 32953]CND87891.1 phage tail fiber assembly protein [Yersinia pseudotuberculosis]